MTDDNDLIALAWDAVVSDAAMARLLERLAGAFDCPSSILVYCDRARPRVDVVMAHGPFADPDVQRRYNDIAHLDPAPAAFGKLRLGEVSSTDVMFDGILHRYEHFLEGFYHRIGLAAALGAPLSKTDGVVGVVAVQRGPDRAPFDARDAARLERLMPHLLRMVELRRLFFELDDKARGLEAALEPVTAAVMVLDAGGHLKGANPAARTLLERGDGLRLSPAGTVVARDPAANRAIFVAMAGDEDERLIRAPREGAGSPYVLRLCRQDTGGWTLMVSDPERRTGEAPARLAAALKLSRAAAELIVALLDGETLAAYAARRGLSRDTAKYHLNAAFAATGTRRQSDLLRHATAVAHDLGL